MQLNSRDAFSGIRMDIFNMEADWETEEACFENCMQDNSRWLNTDTYGLCNGHLHYKSCATDLWYAARKADEDACNEQCYQSDSKPAYEIAAQEKIDQANLLMQLNSRDPFSNMRMEISNIEADWATSDCCVISCLNIFMSELGDTNAQCS